MSIFTDILKEATAVRARPASRPPSRASPHARRSPSPPTASCSRSRLTGDYYGYQSAAVQTIIEVPLAIVGYPRHGKTRIAIASARHHVRGGRPGPGHLPAVVRLDPWEREFQGQFPDLRIASVKGTKARNVEDKVATSPSTPT